MAKPPSYSPEGLALLGAPTLARLVFGEAERNGNFKRLAKAALAGAKGPDAVAKLVDRRLASLEKADGRIGWRRSRAFRDDLDSSLRAVTEELGALSPDLAGERLLRFLALATRVMRRTDDPAGRIRAVFTDGAGALAALAPRMGPAERAALAADLVRQLGDDDEGVLRTAAFALAEVLEAEDLARFGRDLEEAGSDDLLLRQHVARRRGDIDGFARLERAKPQALRDGSALAEWFLELGRAEEALVWVERDGGGAHESATRRTLLRAAALDALGRPAEAQDARWARFAAVLDAEALRAFLGRLGDFEEFDAADRAAALAADFPDAVAALRFLTEWPNLKAAGDLVLARRTSWTGRLDAPALEDAAERLDAAQPLAATVLRRVLAETILARGWIDSFPVALAHLRRLDDLAGRVPADLFETAAVQEPAAWRHDLRRRHSRRAAFWSEADRSDA